MLFSKYCHHWRKCIFSVNTILHNGNSQPSQIIFRSFRKSAYNHNSRSAGIKPTPLDNYACTGPIPSGNIFKALAFTGAFSVSCFAAATVMEYENGRQMILEKGRIQKFPYFSRNKQFDHSQNSWQNIKLRLQNRWDHLNPGEKVFVPICALNLMVFALWRIPNIRRTMTTYFCSNPAGRAVCWPMFLSTFSHYSIFHIFANMYVLHSFTNPAVLSLGKEQFLAVYLSAGVIASMSSILYKAITSQAGLSIGASGAIMAILAYVCTEYPDTQLNLLFLPMLTFSAGAAIKVIIGIDLMGCIMGWKFFDHAAHLGGALFGIFWAYFGSEVWRKRIPFLSMYHDWRKTK